MRVLLVEDDERLARVIKRVLEQEHFVVDLVADGPSAITAAAGAGFDVIILDVMLPLMNGIQVSKVLRESGNQTPILMLTALGEVHDRVRGLDSGADDYLTKPFSFDELLARLRALMRRRGAAMVDSAIEVGRLRIDLIRHAVTLRGELLDLTPTEFRLLEVLAREPQRVFSRTLLLEHVWGYAFEGNASVVETYVHYLRSKIKGAGAPRIKTVRGVGYALEPA
jgi:two-component system OmpR family response regulator